MKKVLLFMAAAVMSVSITFAQADAKAAAKAAKEAAKALKAEIKAANKNSSHHLLRFLTYIIYICIEAHHTLGHN